MKKKILEYINERQKGKSGIYPYWVAQDAAVRFKISIDEALKYVTLHIQEVVKKNPYF